MKNKLLLVLASFLAISTQAQNTSGTITYEEVITLNIELDEEMAQFAAMIPKEQRNEKLLYFSPQSSVYKNKEKAAVNETNMSNNGMEFRIKMDSPDEVLYKDLLAGKTYEQKEFMGRKFLINGDVKKYKWKMTGNQKEISGYPCQEAVTVRGKDTVIVWFTAAIPVMSGPGSLGNLPGLILEAYVGKNMVITAQNIVLGNVDKTQMVKPKGGKKLTADEFEKIVKEKTEERGGENGANGGTRIMIRTEVH